MNEPVNVAAPNWACPWCGRRYREDLDAARACAALGPADDFDDLPDRVAVWDSNGLSVVALGPTMLVSDPPRHERRYGSRDGHHGGVYGGYNPADLDLTPGALNVTRHEHFESDYAVYGGALDSLLGALSDTHKGAWPRKNRHDSHRDDHIDHIDPHHSWWVGPLTAEAADAFNTLAPTEWSRLDSQRFAVERMDATGHDRRHGTTYRYSGINLDARGESGWVYNVRSAVAAITVAHGFAPWDRIGITRWCFHHADTVDGWLHDRVYRWIRGDDVSIPALRYVPPVRDSRGGAALPAKPNKKRVEALARWGVDPDEPRYWQHVSDAAMRSLRISAPTCPVPNVTDHDTFRKVHR